MSFTGDNPGNKQTSLIEHIRAILRDFPFSGGSIGGPFSFAYSVLLARQGMWTLAHRNAG